MDDNGMKTRIMIFTGSCCIRGFINLTLGARGVRFVTAGTE